MASRVLSDLIAGDLLVLGGTYGAAGTVTLHESTSGALDAGLTVQGTVTLESLVIAGQPLLTFVAAGTRHYTVDLNTGSHAVTGQANTYYIDKGATTYGYNVAVDEETDEPLFRVVLNGIELRRGVSYDLVRSQSSGVEGPAATGSLNAIQLTGEAIPVEVGDELWYEYQREGLATA